MPRNLALFAIGLLALTRCLAYVGPLSPNQSAAGLAFVDDLIPLWVYAILWGVASVFAFAAIFTRKAQPLALGANLGICLLWAGTYMLAWALLDSPRGWVTGTSYLVISLLIVSIGLTKERVTRGRP